ncbi:hypothetical protein C0J52_19461 [Blattella germanica]|nr:hypothetical protein C0J52_19461 [Blattella germanica]
MKRENWDIAWSPNAPSLLKPIMDKVIDRLNDNVENITFTQTVYDNQTIMLNELVKPSARGKTLLGIAFEDSIAKTNEFPSDIKITYKFPSELRLVGNDSDWRTNTRFPMYQSPGPREQQFNSGGLPSYWYEGFLLLEHHIFHSIFDRLGNGTTISWPEIQLQRFPYPTYTQDDMLDALKKNVPLLMMVSFVYTCISIVKVVTLEKERQLKESMKIMGLPNWLHWTAWFLKSLIFLMITVILIVILLKIPWYPDTDLAVFSNSDPSLLLVFYLCYMVASICFCFMVSSFFNKGEGMQWKNIWKPVTKDDQFVLGHVVLMLIADAFIYLIITLYIEAVFPGEYGVPEKWYFPLQKSYWFRRRDSPNLNVDTESPIEGNDIYEAEPKNLPAGIQIKHLTKTFKNKVAVKNLSLNMYEGQITVLLGHNGAGKTTTMSMLTGMFTPTRGTALVGGYDVGKDIHKVRESLGFCPQHNILFDELTVREHLYFFSKLKGLTGNSLDTEIRKYIKVLDLEAKENAQSRTLSGGMKRKLAAGVALCGGSKVVLFDEPTSGLDPAARRAMWEILQTEKEGRTLLLSTHFMDEADLLGDRIAIMAGGELQCCGSSFFLKKKYGAGYHLIIVKGSNCDVKAVTGLLREFIADIRVDQNIGSELSFGLLYNQLIAMFMKKMIYVWRTWYVTLVQILLPTFCLIIAITAVRSWLTLTELRAMVIDLQSREDLQEIRQNNIVGVTFGKNGSKDLITGWFNNLPYHSVPLTIGLIHNSLLKNYFDFLKYYRTFKVIVNIDFVGFQAWTGNILGFQVGFTLGFSMAFVTAFFIIFYIKERECKAKHLQAVSGVNVLTFWGSAFIWDMFLFLIPSLAVVITFVIFQEDGFKTSSELGRIFLVLACFGWSVLPATYLCSFLFKIPLTGFSRMTMVNLVIGVAAYLTVTIMKIPSLKLSHVAKALDWIFIFCPHYSFCSSIHSLYSNYFNAKTCRLALLLDPLCSKPSVCCKNNCHPDNGCIEWSNNYFSWEVPGIGRNILFFILDGVLCIIILVLVEYRVFERFNNEEAAEETDSDVMDEKIKIHTSPTSHLLEEYDLVLKDVTKYYGHFLAVDKLCLAVKKGECFGLLGVNGAGKTTTFKMMTGDVKLSLGEGYVCGLDLKTQMKHVHQQIGYCPQFDAVLEEMTGKETLTMFCLLRGIPIKHSVAIIEHGGNKRKLSTAISLIGDPPIVYLDEPTTGMDPVAKRHLWNVICKIRDSGKCIVLTSHSMEECEALCTRLAIMVNGKFRCLGSTQHLKNKFAKGYTLIIKVKKAERRLSESFAASSQSIVSTDDLNPIKAFIEQSFPGSLLVEEYQGLLTYSISNPTIKWSKMFGIMEKAKQQLNIEDYSLGQTSLEQVRL